MKPKEMAFAPAMPAVTSKAANSPGVAGAVSGDIMSEPATKQDLQDLAGSAEHAANSLFMLYETFCFGQTGPDGDNCKICGDNDHQAFECRFNPFLIVQDKIREANRNDPRESDT